MFSALCEARTESVLHVLGPGFVHRKPEARPVQANGICYMFALVFKHMSTHISHICIMVVVHTHEFYHLDLGPSHHTILYICSQFVQIEYCFW